MGMILARSKNLKTWLCKVFGGHLWGSRLESCKINSKLYLFNSSGSFLIMRYVKLNISKVFGGHVLNLAKSTLNLTFSILLAHF